MPHKHPGRLRAMALLMATLVVAPLVGCAGTNPDATAWKSAATRPDLSVINTSEVTRSPAQDDLGFATDVASMSNLSDDLLLENEMNHLVRGTPIKLQFSGAMSGGWAKVVDLDRDCELDRGQFSWVGSCGGAPLDADAALVLEDALGNGPVSQQVHSLYQRLRAVVAGVAAAAAADEVEYSDLSVARVGVVLSAWAREPGRQFTWNEPTNVLKVLVDGCEVSAKFDGEPGDMPTTLSHVC